ncbi:hypothetical protein F2Q68_00005468 [Brassica cretica]|uniref:Uncharacterized protein n=1 Tax=Brassica cretica TaxID=69181 RepID=A0A8S9JE39_BRACR|nr:hypothetical protein F2Q68_00005468 [Brassica cretica]
MRTGVTASSFVVNSPTDTHQAKGSIPDNQNPFVKIHIFRHIITAEKDGSVDVFRTIMETGFQLVNSIPSRYLMKFRTDLNVKT